MDYLSRIRILTDELKNCINELNILELNSSQYNENELEIKKIDLQNKIINNNKLISNLQKEINILNIKNKNNNMSNCSKTYNDLEFNNCDKNWKETCKKVELRLNSLNKNFASNLSKSDKYGNIKTNNFNSTCTSNLETLGDLGESLCGDPIDNKEFISYDTFPTTFAKGNIVEHPNHYGAGKFQCLEAMLLTFGKQATLDFCRLNAFKYLWRSDHKGTTTQDIEKAGRYIEYWKVLNKIEGNKDDGSFHEYLNK